MKEKKQYVSKSFLFVPFVSISGFFQYVFLSNGSCKDQTTFAATFPLIRYTCPKLDTSNVGQQPSVKRLGLWQTQLLKCLVL